MICKRIASFERRFVGLPLHRLGIVTTNDRLTVYGPEQAIWIDANLGDLKEAWQKTLRELQAPTFLVSPPRRPARARLHGSPVPPPCA